MRGTDLLLCLALAAATAAVFAPVGGYPFVLFDDPRLVVHNEVVRRGLTLAGVRWAFGTLAEANWVPLTWISHMADVSLFGLDAGAHHLENVAWHAAAAVALFVMLREATGTRWRPAAVAALFALHPLHVEPVAWIALRRDVLSAFLLYLACLAHVREARRPGRARRISVVAAGALAMAAKPSAIVLPLLLVVLDGWPLGRLRGRGGLRRSLVRQLPLLAAAAGVAALTVVAQQRAGALTGLAALSLPARVANALLAAVGYLGRTLWPADLAVLYPHPGEAVSYPLATGAGLLLAAVTALAWRQRARRPWLGAGWVWYLVCFAPLAGLVQAGVQGMADRYTYLSLTGIFTALAWLAAEAAARPALRRVVVAAAAAAIVAAGVAARLQVRVWRDSATLFAHAAAVTRDNWLAYDNLGAALQRQGRYAEAVEWHRRAADVGPRNPRTLYNLGIALRLAGRPAEAVGPLRESVQLQPAQPEAWRALGLALAAAGRDDEAESAYRAAVGLRPDYGVAWVNLAAALGAQGRAAAALEACRRGAALLPGVPEAQEACERYRERPGARKGVETPPPGGR